MAPTLALAAILQFAACASFLYVAGVLASRVAGEGRAAERAFVTFWAAMAALIGVRGVVALWAVVATPPFPLVLAQRYVEIGLIVLAGWGMTFYVAYLYSGKAGLRWPLLAYFVAAGAFYAVVTYLGRPLGVNVGAYQVGLSPPTPDVNVVYALVGVPIILATLAYLSLAARVPRPMQRYRVILVSLSILAWVVSGLVGSVSADPFWSFVTISVFGMLTAVGVFAAYRPPRFVSRRLDPASKDALEFRLEQEQKRAELASRIGALI